MEKKIPKSVLAVMFVSVLSVCQTVPANELAKKEQWEYASTTPDGKYPELVTYTLGKMTGANNSNLPKGETYENNAYTRYLSTLTFKIRMYLRKRMISIMSVCQWLCLLIIFLI